MSELNGDRATIQELLVEVAVLNTKIEEREKALGKQAFEYERRLKDLNHAHAEAQRVLHTYLTRDKWEESQRSLVAWQAAVSKELDHNRGRNSTVTALGAAVLALAAIGVSVWNVLAS